MFKKKRQDESKTNLMHTNFLEIRKILEDNFNIPKIEKEEKVNEIENGL